MKSAILKNLLEAHASKDEMAFRKAALQMAATESAAGHVRVADNIRTTIAKWPPVKNGQDSGNIVDIASPRGDLVDILDGGHREERLWDIVLTEEVRELIERVILENRMRSRLEAHGVSPRKRLLFHGPPGCGKTLAAAVLAGEMDLPLMTVRLDALFSRFLGATGKQLRAIFDEMPKRPGIYLFDEFDSIAKARGCSQDVGEMNRVVTAFLQLVDADVSESIIVAATNHFELLDRAIFRRFDAIVPFEGPTKKQLGEVIRLHLNNFGFDETVSKQLTSRVGGWSFADVVKACNDAVRTMALNCSTCITEEELIIAVEELKRYDPSPRKDV